jgi:putative methionine-R-sulfoxide reductase with GAF domain
MVIKKNWFRSLCRRSYRPYGNSFWKGICGQVAVSNETFVVPDVWEQDNYLACSLDTKAEIVVPIIKDGKNIGQIDIDSHTHNPFTAEDREMLEWLCEEIAKICKIKLLLSSNLFLLFSSVIRFL